MGRYTRQAGKQYSPAKLKKRRFQEALGLKPVGEWSQDLLQSPAGKVLKVKHWENVLKELKKSQPKNLKEHKTVVKKAADTPQQRLVILYEVGLRRPLTAQEFLEYLTLYKENFPSQYAKLHGKKSPKEVAAESLRDWKKINLRD